jgi:hypothetical protein
MKGTSLALLAALAAPAVFSRPLAAQETLTRVQLLALQQQMRDDGCVVKHVTGEFDAPTRAGIACEKKRLGISGGALDVLEALNIGFAPNDNPPSGGGVVSAAGSVDPSALKAKKKTAKKKAKKE